jgi:thioredoxin 1
MWRNKLIRKSNALVDLDEELKVNKAVFVLFYASWCPFSQKFLPVYEKCAKVSSDVCISVVVDDREDLCEKYSINVYPTVLFFENGAVSKRLDGSPGAGLAEAQLKKLLNLC